MLARPSVSVSMTIQISRESNYSPSRLYLSTFAVVCFTLLAIISITRPVDADEGLYHYAANAFARGQLPYLDFFYPQFPLLLPAYAWIGSSLLLARALSVLFSTLAVVLFVLFFSKHMRWSWAAAALLVTHSYFLLWGTVIKSYPLTMLLSVLGVYFVSRHSPFLIFLGGVAMGLAAGVRLYYGAICVIWLAIIILYGTARLRRAFLYTSGVVIAALPAILLIAQAPQNFWAHCIWAQQIRSEVSITVNIWQKLNTLGELFLDPQWLIVFLLVALGYSEVRGLFKWLTLSGAASLTLTSLVTSPTYTQYYSCVLPFLLPFIASGLSVIYGRVGIRAVRSICAIYLVASPLMYIDYVGRNYDARASMQTTAKIVEVIHSELPPGSSFFTFFSGFAAWSDTITPPGFENIWSYVFGKYVDPKLQEQMRFTDKRQAEFYISSRNSKLVLLGEYPLGRSEMAHYRELLLTNGYQPILSCATWLLFRRIDSLDNSSIPSEHLWPDVSTISCTPNSSILSALGPKLFIPSDNLQLK